MQIGKHRAGLGWRVAAAATMAAVLLGAPLASEVARAGESVKVDAVYLVEHPLASGSFRFTSRIVDGRYSLTGSADIQALLGLYRWRSETSASGLVGAGRPRPKSYDFRFDNNGKRGNVAMQFPLRSATEVKASPPLSQGGDRVPVSRTHLRNALDPMTALIALSGVAGNRPSGNPCSGTIPVFDGKQRFDLVLSAKGRSQIAAGNGHGLSTTAFVCQVSYKPVAGYKMNTETQYMMDNTGIEVWLVPAPRAKLFVPYKIVLPTVAGEAHITNRQIHVDTDGHRQVAMVY
ncbi:MAG: DUF3108 domain-containing protein [Rhizobiales bacterium]|nr:DUF3108 domain-containing protein [Hyphomicrobiales bacterium]